MFKESLSILKIKSFSTLDMRVKVYASVASLFSSTLNNYRLAFLVQSFVKKTVHQGFSQHMKDIPGKD